MGNKKAKINRERSEKRAHNLITFAEMTPEKHLELSVRGGKASGEARRKKREKIEQIKLEQIAEAEQKSETAHSVRQLTRILAELTDGMRKIRTE